MKEKQIVNARKLNKARFISGITICSLVIVVTFIAVALSLSDFFDSGSSEAGLGTLKMFTTISNIIAAFSAAMCLPFQIDGLRRDRYKLPSWIVVVMYVGTVGVFLTFFSAVTIISIYQGFVKTMFTRSSLFLHTINPILITILFTLVIADTRIKFVYSFIAMAPIIAYMILYFIMVFLVGAWKDHYKTNAFFPWPISLVMMLLISFGICQLIRFLHNLLNKNITSKLEDYYIKSPDFDFPNISNAVAYLAELESKFYHEGDDVDVPTDIIELLTIRYSASKVPVDILYDIYLENYLMYIGKKAFPIS